MTLEGRYGGDQRIEAQANVIRNRPSRASRTISRRSPRLSTVNDALENVFALESFGNGLERVEDALDTLVDAPESAADALENVANTV